MSFCLPDQHYQSTEGHSSTDTVSLHTGFIFSSSTARLLGKGVLVILHQLSDAITLN